MHILCCMFHISKNKIATDPKATAIAKYWAVLFLTCIIPHFRAPVYGVSHVFDAKFIPFYNRAFNKKEPI